MRDVINPPVTSHAGEVIVNLVICGTETWDMSMNIISGCGRGLHHSQGLFCVRLHGQETRFDLFVPGQRRVEFDSNGNLCIPGGWGLITDIHSLRHNRGIESI